MTARMLQQMRDSSALSSSVADVVSRLGRSAALALGCDRAPPAGT